MQRFKANFIIMQAGYSNMGSEDAAYGQFIKTLGKVEKIAPKKYIGQLNALRNYTKKIFAISKVVEKTGDDRNTYVRLEQMMTGTPGLPAGLKTAYDYILLEAIACAKASAGSRQQYMANYAQAIKNQLAFSSTWMEERIVAAERRLAAENPAEFSRSKKVFDTLKKVVVGMAVLPIYAGYKVVSKVGAFNTLILILFGYYFMMACLLEQQGNITGSVMHIIVGNIIFMGGMLVQGKSH